MNFRISTFLEIIVEAQQNHFGESIYHSFEIKISNIYYLCIKFRRDPHLSLIFVVSMLVTLQIQPLSF